MLASVKLWAFAQKRRVPRAKPNAPRGRWIDAIAVVLGLEIYFLAIGGLHAWLFGVSPLA